MLDPKLLKEVYENAIGPSEGLSDPDIQKGIEELIATHGPMIGLAVQSLYKALETHTLHKKELSLKDRILLAGSILTLMNLFKGFRESLNKSIDN